MMICRSIDSLKGLVFESWFTDRDFDEILQQACKYY